MTRRLAVLLTAAFAACASEPPRSTASAAASTAPPVRSSAAETIRGPSLRVPTAMHLTQHADGIAVVLEPESAKTITPRVGHGKTVGHRVTLRLVDGAAPKDLSVELGTGDLFAGQSMLQDLPAACRVKATVEWFETDVPAGHMWQPESKGYRLLESVELEAGCP